MYLDAADPKKRTKSFTSKAKHQQRLLNESLEFLAVAGIPIDTLTPRKLEMMALCFLAVVDVKSSKDWALAKDSDDGRNPRSRDIIRWINENFGEEISMGSYDDIRRQHLLHPVLAGIVLRGQTGDKDKAAATNDPNRGYAMNPGYSPFARSIGAKGWQVPLAAYAAEQGSLSERLAGRRELSSIPVVLPDGKELEFSAGEHNLIQKAIIEEFLPRYGYGAEVLYVGDTKEKFLCIEAERLSTLGLGTLSHDELPDVVAYSPSKNWVYLIEAVHSSGPISEERIMRLADWTKHCKAEIIYITAFLDRKTFRKWATEIAWETEVWIAEAPDHMIHFNGDKFLGPHQKS